MRRYLARSLIALSGCGSCSWFPLLPDNRNTVDRAHELSETCEEQEDAGPVVVPEALSPSLIERVEAAYTHMNAGAGGDLRLRGVKLHLRPALNMPVGVLERALECHEARVTLGDATELPDDPYVLPGVWLEIDVSATKEGLVAAVLADGPDDARRVVERAHRFAPSARVSLGPPR
jgi:hypothetical protein